MNGESDNQTINDQAIHDAFLTGPVNWNSCDWYFTFEPLGIDLCGLKSIYAQRMARATCGKEAVAWQQAVELLQQIELDARHATAAAVNALAAVDRGDTELAWQLASQACQIEAKWHSNVGWRPFADAIHSRLCSLVRSESHQDFQRS